MRKPCRPAICCFTREYPTFYRATSIDGLSIFYREAGLSDAPVLLLLHGLPSSSRMVEPLFVRLSDRYHLSAPDFCPLLTIGKAPRARCFLNLDGPRAALAVGIRAAWPQKSAVRIP
jgi:hypothetical protein